MNAHVNNDKGIFAYGTLMFPEVRNELIGNVTAKPAILESFDKILLKAPDGKWYPALIPSLDEKSKIHGVLLPNLTDDDIKVLDNFEGVSDQWYKRELVEVSLSEQCRSIAETYLPDLALMNAPRRAWDQDEWNSFDVANFIIESVRPFKLNQ